MRVIPLQILLVLAMLAPTAHAQPAAQGESKTSKVLGGQLTTILNFGLAGGALGLSTLSFYGRPQDKLTHIQIGLALGIMVGAVYSTSQVVSDPSTLNKQAGDFDFERDYGRAALRAESAVPLAFQWTVDF